ncbi:unnamed protein product [Leuciscus chuanchicus]
MHHCEEREEDGKEKEECGAGPSCVSMKSDQSMRNPVTFTSDLRSVPSSASQYQTHIMQVTTEAALQTHTLETRDLQRVKDHHKTSMKIKFEKLFEGMKLQSENKDPDERKPVAPCLSVRCYSISTQRRSCGFI